METTNNFHLLPFLTNITSSDKEILLKISSRLRPDSINYEDCWGYIIQATRYGGLKWYDPTTESLIFFGRKSDTDATIVVPVFFAEPKYLAHVIKIVQETLKAPQIILKNINPQDVDKFMLYGFHPYNETQGWSAEVRFDDQTYPQQIVDLQKLVVPKGKAYHQLKKSLNKKPYVSIRRYNESDKDNVLHLFALKDGNARDSIEREKGMYFVSHAMYPDADIDKFVIIDKKTNEIIGFTATSDISTSNTALVASIFKVGVRIASIWGIYHTLLIKYREGFALANLGGCETEGTYVFLHRNFRPIEELSKTHLVYLNTV